MRQTVRRKHFYSRRQTPLTFLNRKSFTQRQAEARPDSGMIRRGGRHHIPDKELIDRLPGDLWAPPVNHWVNQPSPTSIPWQSISLFPDCFSWLPLTAQQPISTLIRRVKSPLNDGWICGRESILSWIVSVLKPLEVFRASKKESLTRSLQTDWTGSPG